MYRISFFNSRWLSKQSHSKLKGKIIILTSTTNEITSSREIRSGFIESVVPVSLHTSALFPFQDKVYMPPIFFLPNDYQCAVMFILYRHNFRITTAVFLSGHIYWWCHQSEFLYFNLPISFSLRQFNLCFSLYFDVQRECTPVVLNWSDI